jgi:hypothetical protein
MVSARWARSERPDSLSLLLRESPEPAAAPFSRKSVTSMARSQSPSWLWLLAKPSAAEAGAGAGAAVRSQRSGTGEPPRAAVGATLADGLRRGATPGGGDRANSLPSNIIDGCRRPWGAINSGAIGNVEMGERESGISLLLLWKEAAWVPPPIGIGILINDGHGHVQQPATTNTSTPDCMLAKLGRRWSGHQIGHMLQLAAVLTLINFLYISCHAT